MLGLKASCVCEVWVHVTKRSLCVWVSLLSNACLKVFPCSVVVWSGIHLSLFDMFAQHY